MLLEIAKKLWKFLPYPVRIWLVRRTQWKFTVSVVAAVFDSEGRILVLDHYIRPGASWGLPGGFIDAGEDPVEALKRELDEETGLLLEGIELLDVRTARRHIEILFRANGVGTAAVKSREIKNLGWFSAGDLPDGMNKRQRELAKRLVGQARNESSGKIRSA